MAGYLSSFLRLFVHSDYKNHYNRELGRPVRKKQEPRTQHSSFWISKVILLVGILALAFAFRRQIYKQSRTLFSRISQKLASYPAVHIAHQKVLRISRTLLTYTVLLVHKLRVPKAISYVWSTRVAGLVKSFLRGTITFVREEILAGITVKRRALTRYMKRAVTRRKRYVRIYPAVDLNATDRVS